jgi:hypothetical protein
MSIKSDCAEVKNMVEEINRIFDDGYGKGYLTGIDIKLIDGLWADIGDIAYRNIKDINGVE